MLRTRIFPRVNTTQPRLTSDASSLTKSSGRAGGRPRKALVSENGCDRPVVNLFNDVKESPSKSKSKAPTDPLQQQQQGISPLSLLHEPRRHESQFPPRLSPTTSSPKHRDLDSFLAYASETQLNPSSNVYKGTHYEYTVAKCMEAYSFTLLHTGRSNDLGIDLIGRWDLPEAPHELRVLVQCKATQPRPAMIRELEGAFAGAPAGWSDDGVMVFLATAKPITPGVRQALQRSRFAMGILQVTTDGTLLQFVWNQTAHDARLSGLTVVSKYSTNSDAEQGELKTVNGVSHSISLRWMGKPWERSC